MYGKRVLITGISGFIGQYLLGFIKRSYPHCQIIGVCRNRTQKSEQDTIYFVDLLQQNDVINMINQVKPDYIFHLAGLVFSYEWDELYLQNVIATRNLLEAVKITGLNSHVIIAGSSAEYGVIPLENLPVTEKHLSAPRSPYGITKMWQTSMGVYYNDDITCPITMGRVFNVIGRGAAPKLSTGDFFSQLDAIIRGKQIPRISVGNLHIKRDFLDIDDVCAGFVQIALRGKPGSIYNICSGFSTSFKDVLDCALSVAGLHVEIVIDKSKMQNAYLENIYGCNEKIIRDTGWKPILTLEASVRKALAK